LSWQKQRQKEKADGSQSECWQEQQAIFREEHSHSEDSRRENLKVANQKVC
jgi:hypothetical protein